MKINTYVTTACGDVDCGDQVVGIGATFTKFLQEYIAATEIWPTAAIATTAALVGKAWAAAGRWRAAGSAATINGAAGS